MLKYQKVDAEGSHVGEPGDLPLCLVGLKDVSLANLDWTDPALGFVGFGFLPVEVEPEPAPPAVPIAVSKLQAQLELNAVGLLDQVEAIMATKPREAQIYWAATSAIHRDHSIVADLANDLELTSEQVDQLFIDAAQRH
jgi:hypothetical protein